MERQESMQCKLHEGIVQFKSDGSGEFAGYASVFGVVDSQRDRVLRGAFAESVRGRVREIPLLWQHKQDEPVGGLTEAFEDALGLFIHCRLELRVQRAREAHALLKSGALKGLSIGYTPRRYGMDPEGGVRNLMAVDLWEVSLVTFPANRRAGVTVVRG